MDFFFKNANFIKSCVDVKDAPTPRLNEVLFVGKSNVGKSSLINALTNNSKLAFTSSKPGHTRLLNYFLIEKRFYFVDAPGYGFSAKKGIDYKFYGDMLEGYFKNNDYLKLVVFLIDSRRIPNEDDLDFFNFLTSYNYNFIICMTKCDKLNQSMKSKIYKNLNEGLHFDDKSKILLTSINDKKTIENLKEYINKNI